MDIPFNLVFLEDVSKRVPVNSFALSKTEALKNIREHSIEVTELNNLRVIFNSDNKDSTFYIEIMDMLPPDCFTADEENFFFRPSVEARNLYLNINSKLNKNKTNFTFLLPGTYCLEITVDNIHYYAYLTIKPKQLNNSQLDIMKSEIEESLTGLSKQFIRKKNLILKNLDKDVPEDILNKYSYLLASYNKFIITLNEINKNPSYKVIKEYHFKDRSKPIKIDHVTIRKFQRNNGVNHRVLSFSNKINYNIPINIQLKRTISETAKHVHHIIKYINQTVIRVESTIQEQKKYNNFMFATQNSLDELNKEKKKISQIYQHISLILNSKWMQSVDTKIINSSQTFRASYYREFDNLYRNLLLNSNNPKNQLQNFELYWKDTPKLYEIWSFIKIVEIISNSNFDIVKKEGWIYEENNSSPLLPFLDPGTVVKLSNNSGLTFDLIYDYTIPKDASITTFEEPLFTSNNHNRPDLVLNIYSHNIFKGSIVVDFKYRGVNNLGSQDIYTGNNYNNYGYKVYEQLYEYTSLRSYFLNSTIRNSYSEVIVKSVFCFFPRGNKKLTHDDNNIHYIQFAPKAEFQPLIEKLEEVAKYTLYQ